MKKLYFVFVLLLIAREFMAQNTVYSLSAPREASLLSTGLGFNILGAFQSKKVTVLTLAEIHQLNRNDLDVLDRTATYNFSLRAKKTSDQLLLSSFILPATIFLDPNQRNQYGEKAVIALESYLMSVGSTFLVKTLVKRTRPFVYNENAPFSEKIKADARMSFFSGHTSTTATSSFLAASFLTANGENKNISPYIWTSAAAIPAIQGYLRWKAGKHFPTDIFIGYIVGAGIGYLLPKLHEGF